MTMPIRIALLTLVFSGAAAAEATVRLSSAGNNVALVELFTSEGCSSCPPADRWLSGLKENARLWKDYVPVAFHVDYWDYIGWRDRFASATYSNRQRQYAREGGVSTVYTPGMFQNGREWRGWYRGELPGSDAASAGALNVAITGDEVSVGYKAESHHDAKLIVHVAILGMGLESRVSAGENVGRTLKHDFVVLGLASTPLSSAGNRYSAELELPQAGSPASRLAVAAWVSTADRQAPIQAVGGLLDD